ncbi:MAG: hypothetical protein M1820_006121 [Bogoriella megaspora]|nr:MAG: hypothetical protein M1820_006121 [Bogoriella megaspora]
MPKGAATEPIRPGSKIPAIQNTPTKTPKEPGTFSPPGFKFTFRHPSVELSPQAKKLMEETRKEAASIRAQMSAEGATLPSIEEQVQRKIATPKGKVGRFSDIHMAEFKKMGSIANHPSAFRANPKRVKPDSKPLDRTDSKEETEKSEAQPAKNLKRSQSKMDVDQTEEPSNIPKLVTQFKIKTNGFEAASPAKRMKARYEDDAATKRPISREGPQQPTSARFLRLHEGNSHLPSVATTPTKSSLARSDSTKSIKTGIPSLTRSPSKPSVTEASSSKLHTSSLLPHSPSKKEISANVASSPGPSVPLLARSPSKKATTGPSSTKEEVGPSTPLLSRTPAKKPTTKSSSSDGDEPPKPTTPLLSRSPSKKALPALPPDQSGQPSNIPLLSRTPAKISAPESSHFKSVPQTSNAQPPVPTTPSASLRARFSALRGASGSAMKSILRSPQRLYSDDPFKIAAGTHIATPPGSNLSGEGDIGTNDVPTVPSVKKHVDFEKSPVVEARGVGSPSPVKLRGNGGKLSAKKEKEILYPSLPPRSPLPSHANPATESEDDVEMEDDATEVEYPDLTSPINNTAAKAVSPEAQPKLVWNTSPSGAGAFTFRAGTPITFGPSASPSKTGAASNNPLTKPTIRHVRPSIPSPRKSFRRSLAPHVNESPNEKGKKRKLSTSFEEPGEEKENVAQSVFDIPATEEKEEARPAKKVKFGFEETKGNGGVQQKKIGKALAGKGGKFGTPAKSPAKRVSGVLSQARLNVLSMPKKR